MEVVAPPSIADLSLTHSEEAGYRQVFAADFQCRAGFPVPGSARRDRRHSPSYLFPGQEQLIDFTTTYAGNRDVKKVGGASTRTFR